MKVSLIFISFILLVFTPFISAQQPPVFQPGIQFTEGFSIEFSEISSYEFGKDISFIAHVFNLSNGVRLINTTVDCDYHLFDNQGRALINQQPMIFSNDGLDWDFIALKGNFSRLGSYSYLVVCNDSAAGLGGFVAVGMDITADGKQEKIFPLEFSIILFGLILIIFGLSKERYRILQVMGGLIWMVMGILTLFPGYSFINWTTLTGKVLGFILIGMGFYIFIEPSFSRDEQDKHFTQGGGVDDFQ